MIFPDEDIPEETLRHVDTLIKQLKIEISTHLNDNNRGERLRNGIKLAILESQMLASQHYLTI